MDKISEQIINLALENDIQGIKGILNIEAGVLPFKHENPANETIADACGLDTKNVTEHINEMLRRYKTGMDTKDSYFVQLLEREMSKRELALWTFKYIQAVKEDRLKPRKIF